MITALLGCGLKAGLKAPAQSLTHVRWMAISITNQFLPKGASESGPSNPGPWFAVILGGFCRFPPNSSKYILLTLSTSGPAQASGNLLPPLLLR
jgi:hypothetical protein